MKQIFFHSRYSKMSLVTAALVVFLFCTLGCPNSALINLNTRQKERVEFVRDDLASLGKSLRYLQEEYDRHLYDNHGILPTEESRYHVSCATTRLFEKNWKPLTAWGKVRQLEKWTQDLFSCFDVLQNSYLNHVKFFHGVTQIPVEVEYKPPVTKDHEVKIQSVESNVIRLSSALPKLEKKFHDHEKEFHKK
ncbi:hypothetical protein JXM67_09020 [candidate division WOR-3 bacterium]|nr:hypothetical protein [candidate division WOR-3 bacterium]